MENDRELPPLTVSERLTFSFTDREEQKAHIDNFLINEPKAVLWVHGKEGAGITRVLNELILPTQDCEVCYVDLSLQKPLSLFVQALNNGGRDKVERFYKRKPLWKLGASLAAFAATADVGSALTIHSITSMIEDSTELFYIEGKRESTNNVAILHDYILRSRKSNVAIIFDHFSQCNTDDARTIVDVILSFLDRECALSMLPEGKKATLPHVYFVIATKDEELENRKDISKFVFEDLPRIELKIEQFTDPLHFSHMLKNAFDVDGKGEVVEYLMSICQGFPGRLEEIALKLYAQHENTHALKPALEKNTIDDAIESIRNENPTTIASSFHMPESLYIRMLAATNLPWSRELLLEGANESAELLGGGYIPRAELSFDKAMTILLERFVQCSSKSNGFLYSVKPRYLDSLVKGFQQSRETWMMFNDWMRRFLRNHSDDFKKIGIDAFDIQRAFAQCSWCSNAPTKNRDFFVFGLNCFEKGRLAEAGSVFEHFESKDPFLTLDFRVIVGCCFYDLGKYDKAMQYLDLGSDLEVHFENYPDESVIRYLSILSEVESVLLTHKQNALSHIDEALKRASHSGVKFELLTTKQKIITNLKCSRSQAKTIFDEAKESCPSALKNSMIYAHLLASSCEFYRGNKVADDLRRALNIALLHDDQPFQGAIKTNSGFDLFWQGRIEEAMLLFVEAIHNFKSCRPHEMAYPLNNLANCYMMSGRFEEAIKTFERALLWNQSNYLYFTLNTGYMVCLAMMGNDDRPFYIADMLLKRIKEVDSLDTSIDLNVHYNIEFVYRISNRPVPFEEEYAQKVAKRQDPTDLPYLWFDKFDEDIESDIRQRLSRSNASFFFDYRFEPWLVTLTHDRSTTINLISNERLQR